MGITLWVAWLLACHVLEVMIAPIRVTILLDVALALTPGIPPLAALTVRPGTTVQILP